LTPDDPKAQKAATAAVAVKPAAPPAVEKCKMLTNKKKLKKITLSYYFYS
jgi:hypothetical protein